MASPGRGEGGPLSARCLGEAPPAGSTWVTLAVAVISAETGEKWFRTVLRVSYLSGSRRNVDVKTEDNVERECEDSLTNFRGKTKMKRAL